MKTSPVFCLALSIVLAFLNTASARASQPLPGPWEAVILTPSTVPELEGTAIERIRVFAWKGSYVTVPFQIDEVGSDGLYVLDSGAKPDMSHRFFSGNDQLVILAESLGERAPTAPSPICQETTGIQIAIGRAGSQSPSGWIYVAECFTGAEASSKTFVQYDAHTDRVETEDCQMGHAPSAPMVPDFLSFRARWGGTGQDVLHGIIIEGEAQLLGGLFRIRRTHKDFRSTLEAWKSGPVRVIRRTPTQARTLGDQYTGSRTLIIQSISQPGSTSWEIFLDLHHDLSTVVHDLVMRLAWHFEQFNSMRVQIPSQETVAMVDGLVSDTEASLRTTDAPWLYVSGPQGFVIGALATDSSLPISKTLIYEEPSPSELILGFSLSQLHALKTGRVKFEVSITHLTMENEISAWASGTRPSSPLIRMPLR